MAEFDDLNAGDESDYAQPKPKSRLGLLLGLLALVGLSGGSFVAYTMFVPSDDFAYTPPPAAPAPAPVAETPPVVDATPSGPAEQTATLDTAATPPAPGEQVLPPPTEGPAAATAAVDANAPQADAVPAPAPVTEAAVEAAAAMPAPVAAANTVDAVNAAIAETSTVPAPSTQQLQPIEPKAVEAKSAAPADEKAEAVKEILGLDATIKPNEQDAQLKNIAKQVEVTPRAKQVIIVKKAYSAQSAEAVNAAGARVLKAGSFGAAVKIYDTQLGKNPSDPIALAGKAQALQQEGRDNEAMEVWQRLLELNPRDVEALTNYLGLLQKQQPDQALEKLKELESQYPENAAVSAQIAMASATLMDTPGALKNFRKAIALDPTEPTYPFNMAVLYDRLGTTDKAREAYLRALSIVRDYPEKSGRVPVETIRTRLHALMQ